jgi:hypothetical protein
MASVTRFIEHGLELLIKEAKRTIARPWRRSLLGVKVRIRCPGRASPTRP